MYMYIVLLHTVLLHGTLKFFFWGGEEFPRSYHTAYTLYFDPNLFSNGPKQNCLASLSLVENWIALSFANDGGGNFLC